MHASIIRRSAARAWFAERVTAAPPHTYDRMHIDTSPSPASIVTLDNLAMTTIKTVELPLTLKQRIFRVIKEFGKKEELEKFGEFFFRKLAARACTETPRVLPSVLIPQKIEDSDKTMAQRIIGKKSFRELAAVAEEVKASEEELEEISRLAVHEAGDQLFKIFQFVYTPEAAMVFLAARFAPSFGVHSRIFHEVTRRAPNYRPKTILDYGAGHAPASLAAVQVWPRAQVTCVEPSINMSRIGKFLTADHKDWKWLTALYDAGPNAFDMVTLSYVLMEMKTQEQRDLVVKDLWRRVSPGGTMVIVDRGTPAGFRYIHRIRELFISSLEQDSWHFVAPCPHESACPLALTGRDWCHFSQQVERIPHRVYCKGERNVVVDTEKYSYLVIRKGPGPRQVYKNAFQTDVEWEKSYFWPRVVMAPIKAAGHTLIDVCSKPNNFERLVVSKGKSHACGYRPSRKLVWGDLWRYPKRLSRREARDYTPEATKAHLGRLQRVAQRVLARASRASSASKHREDDNTHYGS